MQSISVIPCVRLLLCNEFTWHNHGHSMGAHRGDPRGRRGPAGRGRRRHVRPGRPVPPDPPDVPASPTCRSPTSIAYPLAWLTTRVYLRPRGHVVADISATAGHRPLRRPGPARARRRRPRWSPCSHIEPPGRGRPRVTRRRAGSRRRSRRSSSPAAQHSWLYEDPAYRRAVASFLATALGGPLDPADAAATIAAATQASASPISRPSSRPSTRLPGGLRTLAQVALPGATRPPLSREAPSRRPLPRDPRRRPSRRAIHRPTPGLERDRDQARRPALRRPPARTGPPRAHPRCRPARGQQQEPAALDVHRLPRPRPPAASWRRSARGPATSPAPPSRSPSSPRTRRPPTRRCRSCSTSGRRPRT